MRLVRAGNAAWCPPERSDIVHEAVRKLGTRRAIILVGMSMALLFLASALLPTEPSAQTTSLEGKIVFVKLGDIWVMDADGTNQTNLTNTPDTIEIQPAWSPDGTKIAFTRLDADFAILGDIWVMDPDGSNQTNLTPTAPDANNFDEYQPTWAPSGAQLAFVREVRKEDLPGQIISEQSDIFVMGANGDNATNITQTEADERDPAWSPDGAKIAFSGVRNGGEEILTMDTDGQNEEILTGDGTDAFDVAPDWSPDGTMVVFQKESQELGCCDPPEIWAVNRDGSGDTNLTSHPSNDTGPSWSPDGSEITFSSDRDSTENPAEPDIYAMPAPTTLPPPTGETASITTSQDSGGAMDFAASDVLLQAASAQTTVRRLTTDGGSTDPDWADTPADTTAPKVKSTSPANGAKRIAPGVNVTATFTEAMDASPTVTDGDPSTITATTFKLMKAGTTNAIGAAVSYSTTHNIATLNPNANLQLGTKYKAVVTTGAQDLAGNRLDQNSSLGGLQQKTWTFTIRN
jgi:Tol biopolymer transport system component